MRRLKNEILKLLCKILPVRKHPSAENRRILIVSTTALGDTLWATPAIESLRKSFPNSYLAVLTSPIGFEVLKTNPFLDKIYLLRKIFPLWKALFQEKFDTVLIFHTSQRIVLPLCNLIGASKIIGSSGINKGLDSLLTDPIPSQFEHEILRRLRMVEKIGGKIYAETLSFYPELPIESPKKWIAIHPGSKDGFKRWPASHFVEVGKILSEKMGYQILITGTSSELPLMQEIASKIPGATLLDTNLSLHAFAQILGQIALLISNDTGPVHLALALKRPVIAIYGATNPLLCGPYKTDQAIVLSKAPPCTPCLKRKCNLPFCLLQIGPLEVINAVQKTFVKLFF
jgi:ADP-heptose:LPS heptosyltransferase